MAETTLQAFTRLCDQRDLAAYGVVGVLDQAIYYCRREEGKYALQLLVEAKQRYEIADTDLENFKRVHFNHRSEEPVRRPETRPAVAA